MRKLCWVLLAGWLAAPSVALADSAADKATAREVATEGIGLFKDGKYDEALDRLRRAQALYDAPVHLLYIARSEDKLGKLVEASETYRLLDRYALPASAPEAWVSAVDDGRKELAVLEPRVPKLRITVEPKDAPEPSVEIDGAPVSSAVLGIARPANPGSHHVAVSAKGFSRAEADAEVKEGETRDVPLKLERGAAEPAMAAVPESGSHPFVGFLGGIRLGAGIPTGTIYHDPASNRNLSMTDAFETGVGLELHAGVRLGKYFTPVLFLEGETLSPGKGFLAREKISKTTATSFGLGFLVGTPPGKFGGFGEIDLAFINHSSLAFQEATLPLAPQKECTVAARGGGIRFGGGGVLPLASWFQLTPFVMATLARFTSIDATGCTATVVTDHSIAASDQRTHGMIFLGVGGDVVLGRNR